MTCALFNVTTLSPARQRHNRFGNPTHTLLISQWWRCSMKFTTMPIKWRDCGICMQCPIADYDR